MTLSLPYRRPDVSIALLAFVHAVGLIGMFTQWRDWFVAMTPVTLLLSAFLLLLNQKSWNRPLIATLVLSFLVGFWVEVAGVSTGLIFGEYAYGATLGWKILEVPLVIGINWLILVYCTGIFTDRLPWPLLGKAVAGAALMTGLDVVIEPVAIQFDYWTWAGEVPPLQNYLAWFGVSFLLLLVFHAANFAKQNKVAVALYIIQLSFFAVLNLSL